MNYPAIPFSTIMNHLEQFILIITKSNEIIDFNEKVKHSFHNPENIQALLPKNVLSYNEFTTITPDEKMVIHWQVNKIRHNGSCIFVIVGNDITEFEELKNKDYALDGIIKKAPGYVFWKDKNSVLVGCNENFAHQVGLKKPEEIVGKTDYELPWEKSETERFILDDKEVIETGISKINIEEPQRQADGRQAVLLTSKVPTYDRGGHISGVLGIYIDITELKNTELQLKLEKKKKPKRRRSPMGNLYSKTWSMT